MLYVSDRTFGEHYKPLAKELTQFNPACSLTGGCPSIILQLGIFMGFNLQLSVFVIVIVASYIRALLLPATTPNHSERDFGTCGNSDTDDVTHLGALRSSGQIEGARNIDSQRIVVRIHVVYDATIEERYGPGEGMIRYLRQFIYATQLVFEQKELDIGIELVVVSAKKSTQKFARYDDSSQILDQFTVGPDRNLDNSDLDILLVGRSIWRPEIHKSKGVAGVLGLANVGTFCHEYRNNTLIVDALTLGHFRTLAHELAHALGCLHDGQVKGEFERHCARDEFIMAPRAGPLKMRWSTCTKRCLENYFSTPPISECIFNQERLSTAIPFRPEFDFVRNYSNPSRDQLPGEVMDIDLQCRYASDDIARSSQTVTGKNNDGYYTTCHDLACRANDLQYHIGQALPGSDCQTSVAGERRLGKCIEGRCDT